MIQLLFSEKFTDLVWSKHCEHKITLFVQQGGRHRINNENPEKVGDIIISHFDCNGDTININIKNLIVNINYLKLINFFSRLFYNKFHFASQHTHFATMCKPKFLRKELVTKVTRDVNTVQQIAILCFTKEQ